MDETQSGHVDLLPARAFYVALGGLFKEQRERVGLSQAMLGFYCGSHGPHICHVERGYEVPSVRLICDLAELVGISPGELLREAAEIAARSAAP
jgi:transcriptional regulator with XRE-family HTH domain